MLSWFSPFDLEHLKPDSPSIGQVGISLPILVVPDGRQVKSIQTSLFSLLQLPGGINNKWCFQGMVNLFSHFDYLCNILDNFYYLRVMSHRCSSLFNSFSHIISISTKLTSCTFPDRSVNTSASGIVVSSTRVSTFIYNT